MQSSVLLQGLGKSKPWVMGFRWDSGAGPGGNLAGLAKLCPELSPPLQPVGRSRSWCHEGKAVLGPLGA